MNAYEVDIASEILTYRIRAKTKREAKKKAIARHNRRKPSRFIDQQNTWVDEVATNI